MVVQRELRLSTDVWTRDMGALVDLYNAVDHAPKGYTTARMEIDHSEDVKAFSTERGSYVCTLVLVMAPQKKRNIGELRVTASADTTGASDALRRMAGSAARVGKGISETMGAVGDNFYGISQDRAESDEDARQRWARETGGHPDDIPVLPSEGMERTTPIGGMSQGEAPFSGHPGDQKPPAADPSVWDSSGKWIDDDGNVYASLEAFKTGASPIGFSNGIPPKLAREMAVKHREFQISKIRGMLRDQDNAAAHLGGVRPFSSRMDFGRYLGESGAAITHLIPRPGGSEVVQYREWLQGIAANCVRELERVGADQASANL